VSFVPLGNRTQKAGHFLFFTEVLLFEPTGWGPENSLRKLLI
jgi:hypothetical protein